MLHVNHQSHVEIQQFFYFSTSSWDNNAVITWNNIEEITTFLQTFRGSWQWRNDLCGGWVSLQTRRVWNNTCIRSRDNNAGMSSDNNDQVLWCNTASTLWVNNVVRSRGNNADIWRYTNTLGSKYDNIEIIILSSLDNSAVRCVQAQRKYCYHAMI